MFLPEVLRIIEENASGFKYEKIVVSLPINIGWTKIKTALIQVLNFLYIWVVTEVLSGQWALDLSNSVGLGWIWV